MRNHSPRATRDRLNTITTRLTSLVLVGFLLLGAQAVLALRATDAELREDARQQAELLARLAAGETEDALSSGAEFVDDNRTAAELCEFVRPFAEQFTAVITDPAGAEACAFGDPEVLAALGSRGAATSGPPTVAVIQHGDRWLVASEFANDLLTVRYEIPAASLQPEALLAERDDVSVVLLAGDRILGAWPDEGVEPGTSLAATSLPPELAAGDATGPGLDGTTRVFTSLPLTDGTLRLALGLDNRVVTTALADARRDALVQVLVAAAVLLLLIMLVARSIARPIRTLAGRLRASGDDLPVLPVVGPSEVRELADRFNALSGDVTTSTDRLAYLAHHDSLTHLFNRDRMAIEIEHAIERATRGESMMAIRIDLRAFGEVNDAYGATVGDGVLAELGRRFLSLTDDDLVVGHLGGDDFLFLGAIQSDAASKLVARVLATVSQPVEVEGITIECTAIAGVTQVTSDTEVDRVLRELTAALEQAKAGPEPLVVHDEAMRQQGEDRARLAIDLRETLQTGGIDVAFQAIVRSSDDSVATVEALARWTHPERGEVAPAEFIPVAERHGLIGQLGAAVLRRSCEVAAGWHRTNPAEAPAISVNVSAHQLATRELPELVASVLRDSGLPPHALILEVTESALLAELGAMSDRLALIRGLGVRVALDDFGTGYSSLSYLAALPVDVMKIDRSFLTDIEHDERARAIVASVIELAHSAGLDVVCEGVETDAQDQLLRGLNADMLQGFLHHRPDRQAADVLQFVVTKAPAFAPSAPVL